MQPKEIALQPTVSNGNFSMSLRFRKLENLHIFFWLIKDISWCMEWKLLGMFMIIPTLTAGIFITRQFWPIMSERCHNLAVVLWIIANAYWMITEFFGWDEILFPFLDISLRHLSILPFTLGILILLYFYLWWNPRNKPTITAQQA